MPISIKPSCPSNYILRDSYKTSSGKCSQSRCVRKTGIIRGKSKERAERSLKKTKANSNAGYILTVNVVKIKYCDMVILANLIIVN